MAEKKSALHFSGRKHSKNGTVSTVIGGIAWLIFSFPKVWVWADNFVSRFLPLLFIFCASYVGEKSYFDNITHTEN